MKKKISVICFTLLSLLAIQPSFAKEPKNLDLIKTSLIKYHDSGAYEKDQAKVIGQAMRYLKSRLQNVKKTETHKKVAIVLDIDETSLSNYPNMLEMRFGGTEQQVRDAVNRGVDPAIAPTLELYRYAKANHVAVFFVTGRTERYRVATEKNLASAGYTNQNGLTFKADDYKEKSVAPYKTRARDIIEKQGYDIILNIGDQQSDMTGGHADKSFKLPNPYYLIP